MARHMHVRQVFGERIMLKYISNERIFYAAGVAGFGVMGLAFGDFALQLQPVPENLMLRTPLAYGCALLLILGGGATLTDRWARKIAAIRWLYSGPSSSPAAKQVSASSVGHDTGTLATLAGRVGGLKGYRRGLTRRGQTRPSSSSRSSGDCRRSLSGGVLSLTR